MGLRRSSLEPLSPTPLPWLGHTRSWSPGFRHSVVGRFPASLADVAPQLFGVCFFRLCSSEMGARPRLVEACPPRASAKRPCPAA